jgi:carboxypeptidase T
MPSKLGIYRPVRSTFTTADPPFRRCTPVQVAAMRWQVALAGLAMATGAAYAADDDALVFITAKYRDRAELQAIASRFQHVIVDEKRRTIQTEASQDDILALQRAGIRVDVDDGATRRMREAEASLSGKGDIGIESISGYSCYRTVEETYATMDALASANPNLARVVDIGPSWLRSRSASAGYRMRVLRLNNSATDATIPNKPNMVVFASIHAREYTPAEILTRFGEWLVTSYGIDSQATWLLDNFRFHLVLQANPDGRKKAEAGLSWRKNVDNLNGTCSANAYGVDLNRNFPFRWNSASGGSSGDPCLGNYRGPVRTSEPETAGMLRYVAGSPDSTGVYRGGVLPDRRGDATTTAAPGDYRGMFIDLHSYARMVLWPWSHTSTTPPNSTPLRTLGRRMAWFNGYSPRQWTGLYVADGTTTDTVYGLLGAPSYTIEMGVSFFESCSTFESSTLPQNLNALKYAARNLWLPYNYPSGPDTTSISISPTRVSAGTPVVVTARFDDSRFNQSQGTEIVNRIVSARAHLDHAPWSPGATGLVMSPADGAFNSSAESATATLSTSGLPIGRHIVFARSTDSGNRNGTPDAALFTVAGSLTFSNSTDVTIPSMGTATSTRSVTGIRGTGPSSLRINVDIRHPNIGDLVVDLIAPGGAVYRLHSRTGGTADNIVTAYVRDASSVSANGTWQLRVIDQVAGNAGFINAWSLVMSY